MNIGEKNKRIVKQFFAALEEGDAKEVAELFAEDGIQRNPYASGIFPDGVKGRSEILDYWTGPIENFDGMSFPIK